MKQMKPFDLMQGELSGMRGIRTLNGMAAIIIFCLKKKNMIDYSTKLICFLSRTRTLHTHAQCTPSSLSLSRLDRLSPTHSDSHVSVPVPVRRPHRAKPNYVGIFFAHKFLTLSGFAFADMRSFRSRRLDWVRILSVRVRLYGFSFHANGANIHVIM